MLTISQKGSFFYEYKECGLKKMRSSVINQGATCEELINLTLFHYNVIENVIGDS